MPNRIIRDGILSSERVNALTPTAELFYRRLMSIVDDFGRFSANHTLLRSNCYPLQVDKVNEKVIASHLNDCQQAGLIKTYTIDGKSYLELTDFRQQIRLQHSKYPDPPADDTQMQLDCVAPAAHLQSMAHLDVDVDVVVDVDGGVDDKAPALDARPPDVSAQIWKDWKKHRKEKKAAITATVIAGIRRQAEKAGMTFEAALVESCERNWIGFRAEWVAGKKGGDGGGGDGNQRDRVRKRLFGGPNATS